MVEWQLYEFDFVHIERCQKLIPGDAVGELIGVSPALDVRDQNGAVQLRQPRGQLPILLPAVDHLTVVIVAVDAEQHFRCNLPESVHHPFHPEIG